MERAVGKAGWIDGTERSDRTTIRIDGVSKLIDDCRMTRHQISNGDVRARKDRILAPGRRRRR